MWRLPGCIVALWLTGDMFGVYAPSFPIAHGTGLNSWSQVQLLDYLVSVDNLTLHPLVLITLFFFVLFLFFVNRYKNPNMAASKSQLASEQQMGDTTVAKSIFYIKFVALTHTLVWGQCGSVLVFAPVHPQHEGLSRSTAIAILLKTIKGYIESALQSQLRCFNRPEASVHNTFPGCPLL